VTLKTLLYGSVLWTEFREPDGSTAYDLSPAGNHGTIYGAQRTGFAYGRALRFDGVDDYVEIPDSPSLDITGDFTIALWLNAPDMTAPRYYTIYAKGANTYNLIRHGTDPPGRLFFFLNTVDGVFLVLGSYDLDQWTHIAAVRAGTDLIYYKNGTAINTTPDVTGIGITNDFALGLMENTQIRGRYGVGVLRHVRIYNRALTAKEILTHYRYPTYAPRLMVE